MSKKAGIIKSHGFTLLLISAILLGALTGYFMGKDAHALKPLGDIFLNLVFTAIIPMVFFSVSSAISKAGSVIRLEKILFSTFLTFIMMSIIASTYALVVVTAFPIVPQGAIALTEPHTVQPINLATEIVNILTAPDFYHLLSQKNILALIIFSILVGIAASNKKINASRFLATGEAISMKVFSYIMYYAPIGFFAYFANLVSEIGPKIITHYVHIAITYYTAGLLYYVVMLSLLCYLAGRLPAVRLFWRNILIPSSTAIATCSSAASIPANLLAARNMGLTPEIYETVLPLGAIIHKDGSVITGVFKIAFLFSMFNMDLSSLPVLLMALGVSLLVGTVMGAIPSGGMLGELLILGVYGFPPNALIAVAAISIISDPMATMLNVTSNLTSTMWVSRMIQGKRWFSLRTEPAEHLLE